MEPSVHERLILFDGVCNLCNGVVRFIIERDPRQRFKFASLQSAVGEQVLKANGMSTEQFTSFIYLRQGLTHTRSDAALNIARDLGGLWSLAYGFIIVPRFLRNAVYDFIARNRYRWFGRKDECWLPTPELKARFVG